MSCKNMQQELYRAVFRGVTGTGDMALWKKQNYNDHATNVLLSLYGSDNQLRGIFSALATNNEINLTNDETQRTLTRGWEGHLRFKSWKIGYGKYHAVIWNENLVSESVIVIDPAKEPEAWESFLKKKRIPFLREWLPEITMILKREGLAEALEGINLKGWQFKASDDEVCDYIVKEIHK